MLFGVIEPIFARQPVRTGAQLPTGWPGRGPGFPLLRLVCGSSARAQGALHATRFLARALFPTSICCSGFLFLLSKLWPDSYCRAGQSVSSDFTAGSHPPRFPSSLHQYVLHRCLPDFPVLHFSQRVLAVGDRIHFLAAQFDHWSCS
jgi:hypothetical protein